MATPSTNFNREDRYFVLKRKDIAAYLTLEQQQQLTAMENAVHAGRIADGRASLVCVVVEHDWPESEAVWSMIEARMTGGVTFVDWQTRMLAEAEARIARLVSQITGMGAKPDA